MKKIVSLMLVALMCLTMTCLAEPDEATIDRFSDTWVDDAVAVEIWYDEGAFHCSAVLGDGGDEATVVRYATAVYNPETDSIDCEGGTRALETYDEAAGELKSDLIVEGLTASFSFDEEDRLIWNDSEGICKRFMLLRLSDAEERDYRAEASAFLGEWVCGRADIVITEEGDAYRAFITWSNNYESRAEWDYTCVYDDMDKVMRCTGTMSNVTYADDGISTDVEVLYEDGEAELSIEDGKLLWNDMKENAADGMTFERVR